MRNVQQTEAWATFQQRLGHQVFRGNGDGWRYVAVKMGGLRWPYLYCPSGPEAETTRAFDTVMADLAALARAQGCWFVRIEPVTAVTRNGPESDEDSLRRRGLRPAPRQLRHLYTRIVDLTPDVTDILKGMDVTTQRLHRNIHKKGVTITSSTDPGDLDILLPFRDAVAEHNALPRGGADYLREQVRTFMPLGMSTLYVARLDDTPIGAALIFDSEDTRVYAQPAMDYEHRSLNAGKPLVVRMILDAKSKGLTQFDFWGIIPPGSGPEHPGYGYTRFKETFGGYVKAYVGTWDLPVRPMRYATYLVLYSVHDKATHSLTSVLRRVKRPGAHKTPTPEAK